MGEDFQASERLPCSTDDSHPSKFAAASLVLPSSLTTIDITLGRKHLKMEENESSKLDVVTLDPDVIEMIADDLRNRAKALQDEADRAAENAEEVEKVAEILRD